MSLSCQKILVVDDNITNLTMIRSFLKSYYDVFLASSAKQMFEILQKVRPSLILLDIEMPEMNGYEALALLKSNPMYAATPVIFLTAKTDEGSALRGFDLGSVDYISKPFSPPLLLKRVECHLLIGRQQETIQEHANHLVGLVNEKVSEVLDLQNALLSTVADLVEYRDPFTGGHIVRTQHYMDALLKGLSDNPRYAKQTADWDFDFILYASQLHDVGKIGIPDSILNKPDRLTPQEFEVMKTHVSIGAEAVTRILSRTKKKSFLRHALNIVKYHHERWDGSGYPFGIKGESIPLEGRLMAIADVYDALVSWRHYKDRFSHEQAREIILRSAGTHLDPALVEIFTLAEPKFHEIQRTVAP